jgi:hypothetical protein
MEAVRIHKSIFLTLVIVFYCYCAVFVEANLYPSIGYLSDSIVHCATAGPVIYGARRQGNCQGEVS